MKQLLALLLGLTLLSGCAPRISDCRPRRLYPTPVHSLNLPLPLRSPP